MIDQEQIERILHEVKITSISDIVSFITSFVSKTALQPIEDLQARICELEKPKGMDRVMIEEVKALVEAMLDQREETIHKEIQRRCRQNICSSFQIPENSRRSLNEVDFMNVMNLQKGTQSQQLKKNSVNMAPPQSRLDFLASQIREIRDSLLNKTERKELQELKIAVSKIDKGLVSKIGFDETEKLILKFQRDIFVKLSQSRGNTEDLQARMMAKIHDETQRLFASLEELKGKGASKLDKKLRNFNEELISTQAKINGIEKAASQRHRSCLQNFESIQGLITQIAEEKEDLLQMQSKRQQVFSSQAFWMSAPPTYKNSQVVWERQIFNSDTSELEFQSGKTGIRLVSAGFYEIACAIYGGNGSLKKGPSFLCNSECIGRLEASSTSSESLPRWRFRELVHIRQNRSTLSIRFDSEENSSCVVLMIRRISY